MSSGVFFSFKSSPSLLPFIGPRPFGVFDLFRICFDSHHEGFAAQVKHPHMLSGESDLVALGYASAALETASDCQAALKITKRRRILSKGDICVWLKK